MRIRNALVASLVAALVCGLAAGCGGDPPVPKPIETPKSTSPSPATPSPDLSKYNAAEKEAWHEAYARLSDFTVRQADLMAAGRATPEALAFFKEYSFVWGQSWDNLQTMEANGITIRGLGRVLWIKPTRIKLTPDGSASVTIERCVDIRNVVVTQHGKRVAQTDPPAVSSVELSRFADTPWRISVLKPNVKSC